MCMAAKEEHRRLRPDYIPVGSVRRAGVIYIYILECQKDLNLEGSVIAGIVDDIVTAVFPCP